MAASNPDNAAITLVTIDTRGLRCPLPLLKVRKEMRAFEPGTQILVLATDPGTELDLRSYCEVNPCEFIRAEQDEADVFHIFMMSI